MGYNIFVTVPIPQPALDRLAPHCDCLDVGTVGDDRIALIRQVQRRDGVLCTLGQRIDAEVFDAAGPGCRVFSNFGVGTDHLDLSAAAERGIVVTNTPGVLTDATADLTWALLLATARRAVEGDRMVRRGAWTGWHPLQFLGADVTGRALGIIGPGRIGSAVARRSAGFDMQVLYVGRADCPELNRIGAVRVDLETCLSQSDFVSLHVPLNATTHHLIGPAQLALMKPSAILINTARGPVVDQDALIQALQSGLIAGAGLDVYDDEPVIPPALAGLDNVICLPHLGSATRATRRKMGEMAVDNLLAVLSGQAPLHPVAAP
ncbi:MAG: 2-hydroxyacid dehydrogenase [Phycisphaerae bacterium]